MESLKLSRKWHLWLIWPALIATLIYVLSAFTHPLMAWTGPQAKVMFPPAGKVNPEQAQALPEILKKHHITQAKIVKLVPFKQTMLLQVSEHENSPRRYFDLDSQQELSNHDEKMAIWLASHYLKQAPDIASIEFITEFRHDYPQVNRLLPIYKIQFDRDDRLSVFIHTETLALAGISNDWKDFLRSVFQMFHSFNWLDEYEGLRLTLICFMVLSCLIMSLSGMVLLLKMKRRNIKQATRRWHRRIAWLVCLPLLLFSISGLYHLLYNSLAEQTFGMRLSQDLNPQHWPSMRLPPEVSQQAIHQISLVENQQAKQIQNRYLYRLSVAAKQEKNERAQRFSGRPTEKQSVYLNAQGEVLTKMDLPLAQHAAHAFNPQGQLSDAKLVTRFGPGYDFRNKRLPVWQLDYDNGHRLFIDPISLILVDQNQASDRAERFSFSFLHKWNMLVPLTGRYYRDVFIMGTLALCLLLLAFGLKMQLAKNAVKATQKNTNTEPAENLNPIS